MKEGLREGELVVANGAFKIDSALQILAKPSMMSPEGGAPPAEHAHHALAPTRPSSEKVTDKHEPGEIPDAFKKSVDGVLSSYFKVQQALSLDNLEDARKGAKELAAALDGVDMNLLKGQSHMNWMKELKNSQNGSTAITDAKDIIKAREGFLILSESMIATVNKFKTSGAQPVFRLHCPMAFDGRGADWLQNASETENPYFGSSMFKCGSVVETLVESQKKGMMEEHTHE